MRDIISSENNRSAWGTHHIHVDAERQGEGKRRGAGRCSPARLNFLLTAHTAVRVGRKQENNGGGGRLHFQVHASAPAHRFEETIVGALKSFQLPAAGNEQPLSEGRCHMSQAHIAMP